ncbi:Wzz/FepE/Etk N-terminal domain-containing protein [Ruegeria arenilitoris]|uniref:Wzz/FepE/Etk N-terminal domain-containing protein n=1 Tax=Ruegeria arenilitoris TaxID=1173585 RepID=UPI001595D827|nr:Wzz/FepE/Etk N-terminal domain-containing protein [Ruegeria arenilitoris]
MNLLAFVRLCWAHRYTIAACAGRGLLLGFGISTFAMKPRFRSETTLVLTRPAGYSDVPSQAMTGLGGDISAINTQVEILGSARMMHNLALELNLQNDPEFNPAILASRWTVPWQKLADRSDSEAQGIVVENVTQAISIKNVRNSDVIRISTTTNDPQKSAEIADTLAQLFVRDQINAKAEGLTETVSWLSDRVAGLEQEIARQEDAIKILRPPTPMHWPRSFRKPEQRWPICRAVFKSLTNWTRHLLTWTPNTSEARFLKSFMIAFSAAFQGRSPREAQPLG